MIHKLTLRNFKSVGDQPYVFTDFDLLVGRNNSGKSTVLQALAIWPIGERQLPKVEWQRLDILLYGTFFSPLKLNVRYRTEHN